MVPLLPDFAGGELLLVSLLPDFAGGELSLVSLLPDFAGRELSLVSLLPDFAGRELDNPVDQPEGPCEQQDEVPVPQHQEYLKHGSHKNHAIVHPRLRFLVRIFAIFVKIVTLSLTMLRPRMQMAFFTS